MYQRIAHVALVVNDYDEAIEYYTKTLNFDLLEDTILSAEKRWVMVAPKGAKECCLVLAKAATTRQQDAVGNQTGGRVFLFLYTDNFERDYRDLKNKNVLFIRDAEDFEYGRVAVFSDLYGNLWDLIQPGPANKGLS